MNENWNIVLSKCVYCVNNFLISSGPTSLLFLPLSLLTTGIVVEHNCPKTSFLSMRMGRYLVY